MTYITTRADNVKIGAFFTFEAESYIRILGPDGELKILDEMIITHPVGSQYADVLAADTLVNTKHTIEELK